MKNKNKRELEKRWAEEAAKKAKAAQPKIMPKREELRPTSSPTAGEAAAQPSDAK